jgi:hypothetical protein
VIASAVKLSITRDSVCAADDCDAPHQRTLSVDTTSTSQQLIASIIEQNYLPIVQGGKATWIVGLDGKTIGVVTQPRTALKLGRCTPIELSNAKNLHFSYLA